MNKSDLARRLAKQTKVTKAAAADRVDRVVHEIVVKLRKGQAARLPGLGKFRPGEKWDFQFDAEVNGGKSDRK